MSVDLKELYHKYYNYFNMYHYMLFSLLALIALGILNNGKTTIPQIITAILICAALDIFFQFLRDKFQKKQFAIEFPYSALISALLIAGILIPGTRWYIIAVAATIAIAVKHIFKSFSFTYNTSNKHIFNPAASGIIAVTFLFSAASNWWIISNIYLAILYGILMIIRIKRYWLTTSYLFSHTIIIAIYAIITHQNILDSILLVNIFFACFMLIEPKTSPFETKKQWIYGAIIAVLAVVFLITVPIIDNSLTALLIGNIILVGVNKLV